MRHSRKKKKHPELVAVELTEALIETYESMKREQITTWLMLLRTAQDRLDLSVLLAPALVRSGISGYPPSKLARYLSEHDLQQVLWMLITLESRARVTAYILRQLLCLEEFAHYARERFIDPHHPDTPTTVPEVPRDEWSSGRRAVLVRTGRSGGRVGLGYTRPMSESPMSA